VVDGPFAGIPPHLHLEWDALFSIEGIDDVAKELLHRLRLPGLVAFEGPVGAGKSTFIRALCEALGVNSEISSPTFGLENRYPLGDCEVIHQDCYRLSGLADAQAAGLSEAWETGSWCFVEWASVVAPGIPEGAAWVHIEPVSTNSEGATAPERAPLRVLRLFR
jgi:tRNA threonylcarbamoyladenosine biosynthesis protein TsaE